MRQKPACSGNGPGANQSLGTLSKTLLQNLEVLSAGQDYKKDAEGKPIAVQVVNLLVTPDQAEHLQHVSAGLAATLRDAGAIKTVTLLDKDETGALIYGVAFEHSANQFAIRLGSSGLIDTLSYGPRLTLSSAPITDARQAPP